MGACELLPGEARVLVTCFSAPGFRGFRGTNSAAAVTGKILSPAQGWGEMNMSCPEHEGWVLGWGQSKELSVEVGWVSAAVS